MKKGWKQKLERAMAFVLAVALVVNSAPVTGIAADGGGAANTEPSGETIALMSSTWKTYHSEGLIFSPEMFGVTETASEEAASSGGSETQGQPGEEVQEEEVKTYKYFIKSDPNELASMSEDGTKALFQAIKTGTVTFGITENDVAIENASYAVEVKYADLPSGVIYCRDYSGEFDLPAQGVIEADTYFYLLLAPNSGWTISKTLDLTSTNWGDSVRFEAGDGTEVTGGRKAEAYLLHEDLGIAKWERVIKVVTDTTAPVPQFLKVDGKDLSDKPICYDGTGKSKITCKMKFTDDHLSINVNNPADKVKFYLEGVETPLTIEKCERSGGDYVFTLQLPLLEDHATHGLQVQVTDDFNNTSDKYTAENVKIERFDLGIKYYFDDNVVRTANKNGITYVKTNPIMRFEFYGQEINADKLKIQYKFRQNDEYANLPGNANQHVNTDKSWVSDSANQLYYYLCETPDASTKDVWYLLKYSYESGSYSQEIHYQVETQKPQVQVTFQDSQGNDLIWQGNEQEYSTKNLQVKITVTEDHFDADLIHVEKVVNDQWDKGTPVNCTWSHNGNQHTATLTEFTDGKYAFRISGTDVAGNNVQKKQGTYYTYESGNEVRTNHVTVDGSKPTVEPSFVWSGKWKQNDEGQWTYERHADVEIVAKSTLAMLKQVIFKDTNGKTYGFESSDHSNKYAWTEVVKDVPLDESRLKPSVKFEVWADNNVPVSSDVVKSGTEAWDDVAPVLTVEKYNEYNVKVKEEGPIQAVSLYSSNAKTEGEAFTLKITDANLASFHVRVNGTPLKIERYGAGETFERSEVGADATLDTADGLSKTFYLVQSTEDANVWILDPLRFRGDGEYQIEVYGFDDGGNRLLGAGDFEEAFMQGKIKFDSVAPVISATPVEEEYVTKKSEEEDQFTYYYSNREVHFNVSVSDTNPDLSTVAAVLYTDKDAQNAILPDPDQPYYHFDQQTNKITVTVPDDGYYLVKITCTDYSNLLGISKGVEIMVDATAPSSLGIQFLNPDSETPTAVFYRKDATVRISAQDPTTQIVKMVMVVPGETPESTIEIVKEGEDLIHDETGTHCDVPLPLNEDGQYAGTIHFLAFNETMLCATSPESKWIMVDKFEPKFSFEIDENHSDYSSQELFYDHTFNLKLMIREKYFSDDDVHCWINGEPLVIEKWEVDQQNATVHYYNVPLDKDGRYCVSLSATDSVNHVMTMDEGFETTTYGTLSEDGKFEFLPIIVDTEKPLLSIRVQDDGNATEELKGSNEEGTFYQDEKYCVVRIREQNFEPSLAKVTITAQDIAGNPVEFGDGEAPTWVSVGDKDHVMVFKADADARYHVTVAYTDQAKNVGEAGTDEVSELNFIVDKSVPEGFKILYTKPLNEKKGTAVPAEDPTAPIEISVDPAYYDDCVRVRFIASDDVSGITKIEYEFVLGDAEANVIPDGQKLKGELEVTAMEDKATFYADVKLPKEEAETYLYNGSFKIKAFNGAGLSETYEGKVKVVIDNVPPRVIRASNDSPADTIHYSQGLVDFEVVIEEHNFNGSDVKVDFKKNGDSLSSEDNKYDNWVQDENNKIWYSQKFPMYTEGDYVLEIDYTDKSGREMAHYKSPTIVVDLTNPVITVDVASNSPVYESNGIRYFSANQVLVVSVKEHNFDAGAVKVSITAVGVDGRSILTEEITPAPESWSHSGDVHTANIPLNADGIYAVRANCTDLAGRSSNDFVMSRIAIDKTAPTGLTVTYGTPVQEMTVGGVTYDYYNGPVNVIVFATDDVSSINAFEYRFVRADGASGVNAQIETVRVGEGQISYASGNSNASYSFTLPGATLNANGQLNGHLEITAINRSQLRTELKETKRIIADNQSPVLAVDYNDHVNEVDGIWYFNEKISASFTLDEANFFQEDLRFSVTKDGRENTPEIAWANRPNDRHFGNFLLEKDGLYEVNISYADRSGNAAQAYKSKQMIVDTAAPKIEITGISNEMASKAEVIGFVIKITDENLDPSQVKVQLKAVVVDKNGETAHLDLSKNVNAEISEDGKTVTYVIRNLEKDAVYTLSTSARDKANNQTGEMLAEDGRSYEKMVFSVNRNGSNYLLSEETEAFVGGYAKEPVDLVVTEINPNELKNVKITLFKNDQTIVLKEGSDYQVKKSGSAETWYRYVYTVDKNVMKEDGVYLLSFYSEDAAGNVSNNTLDTKNVEIRFAIDKTSPNVIITNVEEGVTYPVESLAVRIQANDNLKLVKGVVYLDGKESKVWNEQDVAALVASREDFIFEIKDDSVKARTLKIVMTDAAGNQMEKEVSGFFVTTNLWIRYVNNKPLMFTSIGLVGLIAFGGVFLISRRRRRSAR